MESVVAIPEGSRGSRGVTPVGTVDFGSTPMLVGHAATPQGKLDVQARPHHVLVQVEAFSCNYRDKSLLLSGYQDAAARPGAVVPFGSEFCARVVAVGAQVERFTVGDRVMADCAYPASPAPGVGAGVPLNIASMGWLSVHESKLIAVPNSMDAVQAASFVLGAQTAAGMIRRSGLLETGGRPVVMSTRSATSIFLVQQMLDLGLEPVCLSSSPWTAAELAAVGLSEVRSLTDDLTVEEAVEMGATHVFDPFFDMNLLDATQLLVQGGSYITCGLRDQHPDLTEGDAVRTGESLRQAMMLAIVKNLTLRGNCLGTTEDLARAVLSFDRTGRGPLIDSTFTVDRADDFVRRTFFDRQRFGKCVMTYADAA